MRGGLVPVLALSLALTGCATTPQGYAPAIAPAASPHFDPLAFFTGELEGKGRLKKAFSGIETTLVESRGAVENGTLRLVQVVREGNKPARTREWTIRQVGPDRYEGTLTDAASPVTIETRGNRLHIAFTMKGGFPTEQWLTLSPDGSRAHNVLIVRKFGLRVAVLTEDIWRKQPLPPSASLDRVPPLPHIRATRRGTR